MILDETTDTCTHVIGVDIDRNGEIELITINDTTTIFTKFNYCPICGENVIGVDNAINY